MYLHCMQVCNKIEKRWQYNTLSSIVEEIELHRGHKENRPLSPRDMWDWEPHEFTESVQEHTQEPHLEVLDRSQIQR